MSISETIHLPTSDQQDELLLATQAIANGLTDIAKKNRIYYVHEWRTVQSIVRLGLAENFFSVGDQLQCYHERFGEGDYQNPLYPDDPTKRVKKLTWDIIGIDYDVPCDAEGNQIMTTDPSGNSIPAHSLTIQLHNCITGYSWDGVSRVTNWQNSDVRAWLNTIEVIDEYSQNRGFLFGLDLDLSGVISNCIKSTARLSADGGNAIALPEKIFLPSLTEVFGGKNENYNEGAVLLTEDTTPDAGKFYCTKDANNVITKVTPASGDNPNQSGWYEIKSYYDYYAYPRSSNPNPSTGNDTNRIKAGIDWWLRSPSSRSSSRARNITGSGGVDYNSITGSYNKAISPCCVIA